MWTGSSNGRADGRQRAIQPPAGLPAQVAAIRTALAAAPAPVTAGDLARRFSQGRKAERKIEDVLRTLVVLGQADRDGNRFVLAE